MSLLNPRHDQLVHLHLDQIHASGRRSKILDVGTGTGSWAISLARRQPYSDVIGIDIAWDQFEGTRLPHGNADFHTVGEWCSKNLRDHSSLPCVTKSDHRRDASPPMGRRDFR